MLMMAKVGHTTAICWRAWAVRRLLVGAGKTITPVKKRTAAVGKYVVKRQGSVPSGLRGGQAPAEVQD